MAGPCENIWLDDEWLYDTWIETSGLYWTRWKADNKNIGGRNHMEASYKGYYLEGVDDKVLVYDSVDAWRNRVPVYAASSEYAAKDWIDKQAGPNEPTNKSKVKRFYAGMLFDEWVEVQKSGLPPGTEISTSEAYIDGHIEGYLTGIYGEAYYTKVVIDLPLDFPITITHTDESLSLTTADTNDTVPPSMITHVDTWKASQALAEEVTRRFEESQ